MISGCFTTSLYAPNRARCWHYADPTAPAKRRSCARSPASFQAPRFPTRAEVATSPKTPIPTGHCNGRAEVAAHRPHSPSRQRTRPGGGGASPLWDRGIAETRRSIAFPAGRRVAAIVAPPSAFATRARGVPAGRTHRRSRSRREPALSRSYCARRPRLAPPWSSSLTPSSPPPKYAHRVVLVDDGRFVAGQRSAEGALDEAATLFGMRAGFAPRLLPLS